MKEARVNKKKVFIPENWDDLKKNRSLFLYAVSLFFRGLDKNILLLSLAFKILKIEDVMIKRIEKQINKFPNAEETIDLLSNFVPTMEILEFVINDKFEITQNYFPNFFIGKKIFAPKSILHDCVAWEFALAEDAFMSFNKQENELFLDKLISVLFREKKRNYLKPNEAATRVPFDEKTIEARMNAIKKIAFPEKWLFYRWYASQREIIIKAHPHVFTSGGDGEGGSGGWADTIISMSTVSNEDKVANTKLDLILRRLENQNREREKNKPKSNQ